MYSHLQGDSEAYAAIDGATHDGAASANGLSAAEAGEQLVEELQQVVMGLRRTGQLSEALLAARDAAADQVKQAIRCVRLQPLPNPILVCCILTHTLTLEVGCIGCAMSHVGFSRAPAHARWVP